MISLPAIMVIVSKWMKGKKNKDIWGDDFNSKHFRCDGTAQCGDDTDEQGTF